MSIIIDKEFQALIPPLSDDEFKQLEENCVRDGIREPLVIWPQDEGNSVLIDGHNRFKIIAKHMLHYNTIYKQFKDRDEAKQWIILNQFGRRNLTAYDRSVLALKLKPMIQEQAKNNQGSRNDICQKSDRSIDTKKELASIAGVSHDTIHKVEAIEAKATERTKQLVRSGDLSINQAYNSVHQKPANPVKVAKEEHRAFEEHKAEGVLNFQEAKRDKENKAILENAILQDFIKLLNSINGFGMTYRQDDLPKLTAMITDDETKIYMEQLDRCRSILLRIESFLIRR